MMLSNYEFGFSPTGLLLYALQLLPNILWMLRPPANNVLARNRSSRPILNFIEAVFGIATVILLIFLKTMDGARESPVYIGSAFLFLAGYYVAWFFYYRGVVAPWLIIIGMAAMPPLYFIFVGLWMKNYFVLIPCVIFGIAHVTITCSNYLKS